MSIGIARSAAATGDVAHGTMPLVGHLREARSRGVRAAIALALGVVVGFLASDAILDVLRAPIEALAADRTASLNYESLTGAFELKVSIALTAGVVLSSPVWGFELLRFISPALTKRERRVSYGFVAAAVTLFVAGAACGVWIVPHVVAVLADFASADDSTILSASFYVGFVLKLIVASGVAFTMPVVIVLLNALGILSAGAVRRSWRIIVLAIVFFSALVTPAADVLSMFLIAIPLTALFVGAYLIIHVRDRRRAKLADAPDAA